MSSISSVRPTTVVRPVARPAGAAATPQVQAPAPTVKPQAAAPKLAVKAQGAVKNTSTGAGALWGAFAGGAGGMTLAALIAIGGGGFGPAAYAVVGGIAAFGAVVGGFGGNRIGESLEKMKAGTYKFKTPTVGGVAAGVAGGAIAACGGLWAGIMLAGGGFSAPLVIASVLLTGALGALGGSEAAHRLGHSISGK